MVKKNLESGEIVFPYDEKTKLIRPLKCSEDDFEALARCLNAFKDADSWPDGFGGNLVFTGELLGNEFKSRDLSTDFIVTAIQDPSKIVGVGFCGKMWNLPNGWYVNFFGVDPAFQKQNYGKVLLLNATKAAYENKAQIITLHTWAGNLKAMPLYKRQGYKWRSNTSVYMENYLPQILNYPLFQDFFSQNCWYDIFKPSITQEPDLEFDEKMAIYEYQFLVDKNHKLTIWVDRTIGRISGFHKQLPLEGEDILIRAKIPDSEAFIGFEEFPITLQFVNKGTTQKILSIKVNSSSQIELKGKNEFNIKLTPNSEQKVDFTGKFKTDTLELDTKIHTQTYSDHEILFLISDGDHEFPLRVGKIPINAIKVITDPMNFTAITKQSISIPLNLQNFMGEDKDVAISVLDGEKISFNNHSFNITVKQYDSSINLLATVSSTPTTIDTFKVVIKTQEGHLLLEKNLPISIFNDNRTLSYELEQQIFIENKNIRVSLFKYPQPGENEITILDKLRGTKIKGHPIILGYPFDDEGSEFYTIELEHQIIETSDGLWLHSTAESNIKRGIRITRKLFVPHDGGPIGIQWMAKNSSERKITDLGLLLSSYWGESEYQIMRFIYSLQEGIVHSSIFELPIELDKDPSSFNEGWRAVEFSIGTIGVLFPPDDPRIDKIHHQSASSRFQIEYKLPELNPQESFETSCIWYTFVDNWQMVQKEWQDKYQYSPSNVYSPFLSSRANKRFGLMKKQTGDSICRALLIDKASHEDIEVAIDVFKETTLKGIIELKIENSEINPNKILLPEIKIQLWSETVNVTPSTSSRILKGKCILDVFTRIYTVPVVISYFDSTKQVQVNKKSKNQQEYLEVNNGFLTFHGSAHHRGQIIYLSTNDEDENLLLTYYPEIKPFLWWNVFYGGIGGIVREEYQWDEVNYNKLKFTPYEIVKGQWKGIGFISEVITYSSRLKGIQVATNFLTLPDSPLILIQMEITNHSGVSRRFASEIKGTFKSSNSDVDQYYMKTHDGEIATFKMQDHQGAVELIRDPDSKWCAYHKSGSNIVAMVLPSKAQDEVVGPYTPNLSFFALGMNTRSIKINPKETLTFNALILLTDDLDKIEPFTNSNLLDLLQNANK